MVGVEIEIQVDEDVVGQSFRVTGGGEQVEGGRGRKRGIEGGGVRVTEGM